MFKVGVIARILFDNGFEKSFDASTEMDYKTKEDAREYMNKVIVGLRETIAESYRTQTHAYINIGNTTIDVFKTSYIRIDLDGIEEM